MWRTKKLNQVCDIQSGLWKGKKEPFTEAYVLRNTNFTAGGKFDYTDVALLQVETKQLEKRKVLPNDIILEKSGGGEKTPVGRVCLHTSELDKPVSLSNFTARLRVINEEELIPSFLHRFLYFLYISGKTEPMQRNSTGIRNLQISQYKDIEVPLPPLAEQRRIVAKLDAAFAEIDKAIEATEAKEAGIRELQAAFLSTSLNEETVTWKTVKLGDVCELAYGKALDKSDRLEGDGIPAFGANGVKTYSKKSLFNEPSIIVGRKGSAGEINKVAAPFWALDVTYYTKIKKEIITLDFLFYTLTTLNLPSMARGVKPGINRNDVYNKNIPLPPLAEQRRIVAKLDAAFADIEAAHIAIKKKKENCEALKSALLAQELRSVVA